jgi:hypothetical protein
MLPRLLKNSLRHMASFALTTLFIAVLMAALKLPLMHIPAATHPAADSVPRQSLLIGSSTAMPVGVWIAVMTGRDRIVTESLQLWFFNPESLRQQPQDIFLKSKLVGSRFICYSKCPKQPVAQSCVVANSESDFAKFCNSSKSIVRPSEVHDALMVTYFELR